MTDPTLERLRARPRWTWRNPVVPILPVTVRVLGHRWPPSWPWEGLDFTRAETRDIHPITSTALHHLRVPWCHPEDQAREGDDPDAWTHYRIYPARDGWRFQRGEDGIWVLARPAS